MQISFKINGATQLSRNLEILNYNIDHLKDFYDEAIDIMHKKSDSIWATSGQNVEKGDKWKPLSKYTEMQRKHRKGYYAATPNKPQIMRWTGRLQEDTTKKITDTYGMLTYNAPYAKELHMGNSQKNLPSRPIIDLDNETNAQVVKALQKQFEKQIQAFNNGKLQKNN